MKKIIKYTILLSLPLVIFLSLGSFLAFDQNWYQNQFNKSGIYQKLDKTDADKQLKNLLLYLQTDEKLDNSFYTDREILHLYDIKNILLSLKYLAVALGLLVIGQIFFIYRSDGTKKLQKILLLSAIFAIIAEIFIIALLVVGFDKIFYLFHIVSFKNDFWLLNPDTEKLVVLFPSSLFFDLSVRILIFNLVANLIIAAAFFAASKPQKKSR